MKIVSRGVAVLAAVLPFTLAFALSAQTSGLQQVPPDSIPESGTFWSWQNTNSPPWPFDRFPDLPLYELDPSNNVYLIDDRSVDYDALEQDAEVQAATVTVGRLFGLEAIDEELGFSSQDCGFSSDDLWLEFTSLDAANATGYFTIHSPETNGVYDLFSTTSLCPGSTSWQWVLECDPGQTNLVVTNLDGNYYQPAVHFGYRYSINQGMLFHFRNPDLKGYLSPCIFEWVQVGAVYARANTFTNNVGTESRGTGLDTIFPGGGWISPAASGDDQDDPGEWTYGKYKGNITVAEAINYEADGYARNHLKYCP